MGPRKIETGETVFRGGYLRHLGGDRYLLCVSGSDFERGVQYGYLASHLILTSIRAIRRDLESRYRICERSPLVLRWVSRTVGFLYSIHFPIASRREMRGMWSGLELAGVTKGYSIWDLWFVNAWPDADGWLRNIYRSLSLPEWLRSSPLEMAPSPHCCSFGAWGESTENRETVFGQNVDFSMANCIRVLAVVSHPTTGLSTFGVGVLGTSGLLTGTNERGVAGGEVGRLTRPYRLSVSWADALKTALRFGDTALEGAKQLKHAGYGHLFSLFGRKDVCTVEMSARSRKVFVPAKEESVWYRAEWSMDRLFRKFQIRAVRRKDWRRDIQYARRRHSLLSKSIYQNLKNGPLDVEKGKKILSRTALRDSLAQLLVYAGNAHIRLADFQGRPTSTQPWLKFELNGYWTRIRKAKANSGESVVVEKRGTSSEPFSFLLQMELEDGKQEHRFTLSSGEAWRSAAVTGLRSAHLRSSESGELLGTL